MNLPNFINFEPFNKLRRQMRVSNLGTFSIHGKTAPDAAPPDVEALATSKKPAQPRKKAATPRKTASATKKSSASAQKAPVKSAKTGSVAAKRTATQSGAAKKTATARSRKTPK